MRGIGIVAGAGANPAGIGMLSQTYAAALGVLKSYGANAHMYLPGVGLVNGLTAGNYIDSGLTTLASVDGPVGGIVDSLGAINATQPTAGSRPTLRRGLVNLLMYSNDLTNAAWGKTAVAATVSLITPDTSTSIHRLGRTVTTVANTSPYTFATRAAPNGYRYLYLNGAATPGAGQACFDLLSGTVSATANGVATISAVGDGSYICCVSATSTAVGNQTFLQVNNSGVSTDTTFAGDGVGGIYCYASGLFQGTLTAQQILAQGGIPLTTTAAASNASAGSYALEFAGAQSLSLGSVPFQYADDFAVIAGARCDTASSFPMVVSVTDGTATNKIDLFFNSGKPAWEIVGTANAGVAYGSTVVGTPCVLSGRKVAITSVGRLNGAQYGSTSTAGVTPVTLTQSKISELAGVGTLQFTGQIGPVIAIKGTVTDADLLTLERFVAALTPNAPSF